MNERVVLSSEQRTAMLESMEANLRTIIEKHDKTFEAHGDEKIRRLLEMKERIARLMEQADLLMADG
ncbi:MAG: hypothetical protein ACREXX_17785 [Gammaproteobacteria bacterium]